MTESFSNSKKFVLINKMVKIYKNGKIYKQWKINLPMEKIVRFDKQGRLYLPEELRKKLQFKMFLAKMQGNGIYLEPLESDPLEALAILGKDKLKHKSIEQLKKEARRELEENASKNIRRH